MSETRYGLNSDHLSAGGLIVAPGAITLGRSTRLAGPPLPPHPCPPLKNVLLEGCIACGSITRENVPFERWKFQLHPSHPPTYGGVRVKLSCKLSTKVTRPRPSARC
jgi:hypothetical protein